jgi:chromosomal replication initiator protein
MDRIPGTARNLDREGAMGNVADVAAAADHGDAAVADRILRELRTRIGDDRFAVWFGDGVHLTTAADARGRRVSVVVGSGFSHEWLRRTFREELEAAVGAICGPGVVVDWEPVAEEAVVAPVAAAPARRRAAPKRSKAATSASVRAAPSAPASGELVVVSRRPVTPQASARRPVPRLADFVVGPSNRMAFAAAEMAIQRPGEMSPLVIHGPSGVGKTHLLEGLCERVRELHPGVNAVCLSAEQFTTAFLQSLHASGLPGFRRTCRGADLLVIDDLQFFVGKKATLLELQHTIDAMHRQGRQVVLGCDRELDALGELGPDLLTRLRGGMLVRLPPPDYDVRRGIVAAICAKRGLSVPDDVVHYVATAMTRHARELFGACNRLEATSQMLGIPLTLDMAEEALADLVRSSARSVRLADIERAVCQAFGIDGGSLQSSRRARTTSHPRMLAMFLARKHTSAALTEIGAYFGRRSHSTVIAAQKAVGEWAAKREPIVLADATWDVEEAIRRVEDVLRAG